MTQQLQAQSKSSSSILPLVLTAGAFAATGLGLAIIAWSRTQVIHDVPLTRALGGDLIHFTGRRSGELAYYAAGPTKRGVPPLVLIHSINAAASSNEMRPLFEYYARTRRVIALDLPGYGFSDRSDRAYLPSLMRDAILDLIEQELTSEAVDIVGLSLSAEYVALAAQAQPSFFRTLTFLTPTGFSERNARLQPNDGLLSAVRMPLWARPIFDLLTSRPSMQYFLSTNQRTPVKRETVDYAYATSHQPNAEIAPFHFLTFKLFTPTIFEVYRQLQQPCLLIYGQDPFTSFEYAQELQGKPNWRIVPMSNAGTQVHQDDLRGTVKEIDALIGETRAKSKESRVKITSRVMTHDS